MLQYTMLLRKEIPGISMRLLGFLTPPPRLNFQMSTCTPERSMPVPGMSCLGPNRLTDGPNCLYTRPVDTPATRSSDVFSGVLLNGVENKPSTQQVNTK
jgi:hypothetical protein